MDNDPRSENDTPAVGSDEIITREDADRLLTEALDTDLDEPEPLVKLLLVLFDHEPDSRQRDSIHRLMEAAYDNSIVHSINLEEYLESIREGRDPLAEARARRYGPPASQP